MGKERLQDRALRYILHLGLCCLYCQGWEHTDDSIDAVLVSEAVQIDNIAILLNTQGGPGRW